MAYTKTFWLNKNDPNFNILTSPPIDADNLNKMEEGIWDAINQVVSSENNYSDTDKSKLDGISNLINNDGNVISSTSQDIIVSESTIDFNANEPSTAINLFEFNDVTNTVNFKKSGIYNLEQKIVFQKDTVNNILITLDIVDLFTSDIWGTNTVTLTEDTGSEITHYFNTRLDFQSSDVPKTLIFKQRANGTGISITSLSFTVTTYNEESISNISHNDLQDRDASDSHPIQAISGLSSELSGILLSGEVS